MKRNDINLLEFYTAKKQETYFQYQDLIRYVGILVLTIAVLGALTLKFVLDSSVIQTKIEALNTSLNEPAVIAQLTESEKITKDMQNLDIIETQLIEVLAVLDQIPRYDDHILDTLHSLRTDNVHFTNITYDKNILTIDFYEHKMLTASAYSLRVLESGKFSDCSYTGYQFDETNGIYRGRIVCILKGGQNQ